MGVDFFGLGTFCLGREGRSTNEMYWTKNNRTINISFQAVEILRLVIYVAKELNRF